MAYTRTWDAANEAAPGATDLVSGGDDAIRNLKTDIRERMAKDHYMDIAGTDADHGEHSKITFHGPQVKPAAVENKGFLYTKDVGAKVELFWEDEDGNEIQLTSAGVLLVPAATLASYVTKALFDANTILYATADNTPAALTVGASTIVGRKSTGDIVALTAAELRTILNVANGATAGAPFGTSAARSKDTSYLAATDGIVTVTSINSNFQAISGYTDAANPPTTLLAKGDTGSSGGVAAITFPVKKGNYYKITGGVSTIYWMPIGV